MFLNGAPTPIGGSCCSSPQRIRRSTFVQSRARSTVANIGTSSMDDSSITTVVVPSTTGVQSRLKMKVGPDALKLQKEKIVAAHKEIPAERARQATLIASGAELSVALAARESLAREAVSVAVVSLPCWELFEQQEAGYQDSVIPPDVRRRVTIEAGASLGWERYAGDEGAIIGIDHFGASAPAGTIFAELGFTAERVADVARRVVRDGLRGRIPTLHEGAAHDSSPAPAESGESGESGVDRTPDSDPGHS